MKKNCAVCGTEFEASGKGSSRKSYCSKTCKAEGKKATQAKATAKYSATPKGKAVRAKYAASPKRRVTRAKYSTSPEGKVVNAKATAKYSATPKGKVGAKARNRARAAGIAKATPKWITEGDMAAMAAVYAEADRLTETTGVAHDVDHTMPLKGAIKRVHVMSGLNVPWNLVPMTAAANRRKGNRWWPDMPT